MSSAEHPEPGRAAGERVRVLPRTIGGFCLWGMVLGAGAAWLFGRRCAVLSPIGDIFLRASQIAVMPYLILELVCGLGRLDRVSVARIARFGGLGWIFTVVLGVGAVMGLPAMLPMLTSSGFFSPHVFEAANAKGLVETYLPVNIFGALAADNFPAALLFSSLLGLAIQAVPRRQVLLDPIDQLRLVLREVNGWTVLLAPAGIFALTAVSLAGQSREVLLRSQALLALEMGAAVLIAVTVGVLIVSCTPLSLGDLWSVMRGPLAICVSTANLVIALPLFERGLRGVLAPRLGRNDGDGPQDGGGTADGRDRRAGRGATIASIDALVPVGFALPMIGTIVGLLFVPFAAWLLDRPLEPLRILGMLATGVPTASGGLRFAIARELVNAGLPLDVLGLFDANANWIYRVDKTLSLFGLALMVSFAICGDAGRLRIRAGRLLAGGAVVALLALVVVCGGRVALERGLAGTYSNDRILSSLDSDVHGPEPREVDLEALVPAPVDLASIKARGVLRVGLREGAIPWAYRNEQGRVVGYDVDLAKSLAADHGLALEVATAPLGELERLLAAGRIDIALGGIQSTAERLASRQASRAYLQVHHALVVRDAMVRPVQQLASRPLGRPLVVGVPSGNPSSSGLERRIEHQLGGPGRDVPVTFVGLERVEDFFAPVGGGDQPDALLTTAEGGAALAVMHPATTMVTVFGAALPSELVILVGGDNRGLVELVDRWVEREKRLGLFARLFQYWIEVQSRGD